MRMCHFQAQNGPFLRSKIFLVQPIVITFIYLLVLCIVQNFKKFLQWIQSYDDAPFLGPKWSICPNFFWKIIDIVPIYLSAPFIVQNFKKFYQRIQSYEDSQFLGQNGPFPQMRILSENLLTSLVSFMHAYLHAKNQRQILIC